MAYYLHYDGLQERTEGLLKDLGFVRLPSRDDPAYGMNKGDEFGERPAYEPLRHVQAFLLQNASLEVISSLEARMHVAGLDGIVFIEPDFTTRKLEDGGNPPEKKA